MGGEVSENPPGWSEAQGHGDEEPDHGNSNDGPNYGIISTPNSTNRPGQR